MAEVVPKCHKFAQKSCIESLDPTACGMALSYCEDALGDSFLSAGVNPYVMSTLSERR